MGLDGHQRRSGGSAPDPYSDAIAPDLSFDGSLRPQRMVEFIGQKPVVSNLQLALKAARERGEPIDHLLLVGLPGLGKTTLAHLVAKESGAQLYEAPAPTLQKAADLAGILTRLERGDVLFIDEVHRLPAGVEEYLYAAMEDYVIDIVLDHGASAQSVRIDLGRFTLVGATTREGLLSAPFRSRFGIHERLEPYETTDLENIVSRSAGILGVTIDADAERILASRARGTPRVVNRFLKRVRDLAQVEADNHITAEIAERGLERMGVDEHGLTRVDRQLLLNIAHAGGRPVGLKTLSAAVGEDVRTLEDVYEPHLLREGLILKTRQGRSLTPRGVEVLGVPEGWGRPSAEQGSLPL